MLDQRLLPTEEKWLMLRTYKDVAAGHKGHGRARSAGDRRFGGVRRRSWERSSSSGRMWPTSRTSLITSATCSAKTRPTAVNLFWAIDRMKRTFQKAKAEGKSVSEIKQVLLDDAKAIHEEDIESQRLIAKFGGELIEDNSTVLTHCNAGALATGGVWGTALGVIRGAVDQGKHVSRHRRRDAAVSAGRPADRVGADAGRYPGHADHR